MIREGKQESIRRRLKLNRGARFMNQSISLSLASSQMFGMKNDLLFTVVTTFMLLLSEIFIQPMTILHNAHNMEQIFMDLCMIWAFVDAVVT